MKIGDVVSCNDPDRPDLKLLGSDNGVWLVIENDEFGTPRHIEPEEMSIYGLDAPPEPDEQAGWDALAKSDRRGRAIIDQASKLLTPEEALATGAASQPTYQIDGRVYRQGEAPKLEGQPQNWRGLREAFK